VITALVLIACSGAPAVPEPAAPAVPEPTDPPTEVLPDPVATTLVFVNDGDEPVVLDRSFGPAAPFAIARLDGPLPQGARIDDVDDSQTGDWIQTCVCACGGPGSCPECEPPRHVSRTIAPGERYEVPWNGQLRTYLPLEACHVRQALPAGSYLVAVCAPAGPCAYAEAVLPTSVPVQVRWSGQRRVDSCEELSEPGMARVAGTFKTRLTQTLRDRPVASCPDLPACLDHEMLEQTLAGDAEDCGFYAIPRGDRVDLLIHLPLPVGHLGGARFQQTWDPEGLVLFDVKYEQ